MINSRAAEETISANIENYIAARGTTRKHLFDRARMSRQTFDRAMSGGRSFTIEEIINIAEALNVTPDKLLPSEWANTSQQAA